jgi:flagellar capping protein FliD
MGERGAIGHLSPEQLQQIADLRQRLDAALKELQLQFERIAQMQAQLDHVLGLLAPSDGGALK